MNSLFVVLVSLLLFFLAYRFFARRLENLWEINPKRSTPAYSKYDSVDYVPAKNWLVLFGHHFSSIAGAGPIIGPVISVMLWGWLPGLLWVIFGSIFIGGVHDFGSLITSVREGGNSIADTAQQAISKRAKLLFSLFVWLALILVISVFAYLCADTFVKEPKIVMPSMGLIPVAMIVGYLLYNRGMNLALVTVFGLVSLVGLIFLGDIMPVPASINTWITVLLVYCYFASVMPVNILLQPRDYLSSFLLFFGVGVGYIGLLVSRPAITMPYYNKWSSAEGSLWPMLFVTVACGAVSGFHALIASGTSSKQLANERYAKRIGYGAMITEGIVAVLAIVATAVLFKPSDNLAGALKAYGPIGIFSKGYGLIADGILGKWGPFIAVTILNAFILTTLDTATRISRYLSEELLKIKNRYLSTLVIIFVSAILAYSGKWQKIWPAFGASNQLVAALALFVISCWLISRKKSARYTLWPAFFMLITTIAALAYQMVKYFINKDITLFVVSMFLIILAGFMIYDVMPVILRRKIKHA